MNSFWNCSEIKCSLVRFSLVRKIKFFKNFISKWHFEILEIQIENVQKPRKRRKRNISFYYQDYVVELLVVIDQKLVEIHDKNDQLIHFVLTLMSHVQVLLNDVTIGNPVSIAMTDIVVLEDNVFGLPSSNIGINDITLTHFAWSYLVGAKRA